jgi:hypothetical protein
LRARHDLRWHVALALRYDRRALIFNPEGRPVSA